MRRRCVGSLEAIGAAALALAARLSALNRPQQACRRSAGWPARAIAVFREAWRTGTVDTHAGPGVGVDEGAVCWLPLRSLYIT